MQDFGSKNARRRQRRATQHHLAVSRLAHEKREKNMSAIARVAGSIR